nr:YgjP-like metallopeptidase domain-containing protein [Sphingomonas aerophila]
MSLDPATGRARLVVPRRAALKAAVAWAEGKADWLEQQRARLPAARPFVSGAVLPVADEALTIVHGPASRSRIVRREGDYVVTGGAADTVARRIETWLRRSALALLDEETRAVASRAGVTVERVSIGDPTGRWGSCASTGAIRYSWRLLLAPGFVRHATVAHEVAHRIHMHHGPEFHALTEELLGADPAPARAWLRANGAALHWYGRSSL